MLLILHDKLMKFELLFDKTGQIKGVKHSLWRNVNFCSYINSILFIGCTVSHLQRWLCNRQMKYEGGFQGRTNKLVDGCYSFWQAGAFPLIHKILMVEHDKGLQQEHFMFDQSK